MKLNQSTQPIKNVEPPAPGSPSLAEIRAGALARISRLDDLPAGWQERLLKHGLAPGRQVLVLQQRPVTILQIDHTELALEYDLARAIKVDPA